MGDTGDDYQALRELRQEEKQKNKRESMDKLREQNINFTLHNMGTHLIVENTFDFWPTTGRFIHRKTKKKGWGISDLLKELS